MYKKLMTSIVCSFIVFNINNAIALTANAVDFTLKPFVSSNSYYDRGVEEAKSGEYLDVIINYDKGFSLSTEAQNYFERGDAKADSGQFYTAIKDYDKAISLYTEARNYFERGDAKADLTLLPSKTPIIDRVLAAVYNSRGISKHRLGQYFEAIQDYDKAISLNSNYAEAYNNRGNAKALLGQYFEAIQDFDKAISLKPNLAMAYVGRAGAKNLLGHKQEAIKDLDIAISIDSNLSRGVYEMREKIRQIMKD